MGSSTAGFRKTHPIVQEQDNQPAPKETLLFFQEDFITPSTFGEILYENFLFDIPKIMDICALYGGENSNNTPLLRKMLENVFSKQPK